MIFVKISQKDGKERQNQHLNRFTIVKNVLQIGLFLQNKANFCKVKIIVCSFVTSEYKEFYNFVDMEKKPIKANCRPLAGNTKHEILNTK